jgi:hypothetical protein
MVGGTAHGVILDGWGEPWQPRRELTRRGAAKAEMGESDVARVGLGANGRALSCACQRGSRHFSQTFIVPDFSISCLSESVTGSRRTQLLGPYMNRLGPPLLVTINVVRHAIDITGPVMEKLLPGNGTSCSWTSEDAEEASLPDPAPSVAAGVFIHHPSHMRSIDIWVAAKCQEPVGLKSGQHKGNRSLNVCTVE